MSKLVEKFVTVPTEFQESFEKALNNIGFILDDETSMYGSKRFYGYLGTRDEAEDEAESIHYQVITTDAVYETEDAYKEKAKQLIAVIDEFEDDWDVPITYNIGWMLDHRITAGIDVETMWEDEEGQDTVTKSKDKMKLTFYNGELEDTPENDYTLKAIGAHTKFSKDDILNAVPVDKKLKEEKICGAVGRKCQKDKVETKENVENKLSDKDGELFENCQINEEWIEFNGSKVLITDSPYEIKNKLVNIKHGEPIRVLYDNNVGLYMLGPADSLIHHNLLAAAITNGYYSNIIDSDPAFSKFSKSKVYSNDAIWAYQANAESDGELVYIIAAAPGETSVIMSSLSGDEYDYVYVYNWGTITTRADGLENCALEEILGKYELYSAYDLELDEIEEKIINSNSATNEGYKQPEKYFSVEGEEAKWTEDGEDWHYWSSEADDFAEDYAKAYKCKMSPKDFLDLTTEKGSDNLKLGDNIWGEFKELDLDQFTTQQQPIFLQISVKAETKPLLGYVVGHEGRHRMLALREAGVKSVDVMLYFDTWDSIYDKYKPFDIKSMTLVGQFNKSVHVTVQDLIPMSWKQHQAIRPNVRELKSYKREGLIINSKTLKEDVKSPLKDGETIEDLVLRVFGNSKPQEGPMLILPNGKFLDIPEPQKIGFGAFIRYKCHACINGWLLYYKLIPGTLWDMNDSTPLLDRGWIRGNLGKLPDSDALMNYIELPKKRPTDSQFKSLLEWLDYAQTINIKSIEVNNQGMYRNKVYNFSDYTSDEIVDKIKKYYATNRLEEKLTEGVNKMIKLKKLNENLEEDNSIEKRAYSDVLVDAYNNLIPLMEKLEREGYGIWEFHDSNSGYGFHIFGKKLAKDDYYHVIDVIVSTESYPRKAGYYVTVKKTFSDSYMDGKTIATYKGLDTVEEVEKVVRQELTKINPANEIIDIKLDESKDSNIKQQITKSKTNRYRFKVYPYVDEDEDEEYYTIETITASSREEAEDKLNYNEYVREYEYLDSDSVDEDITRADYEKASKEFTDAAKEVAKHNIKLKKSAPNKIEPDYSESENKEEAEKAFGRFRQAQREIDFANSQEIVEAIEKHEELNPKLWNGTELKPEVKEAVQKIANTFVEELTEDGIKFNLKDIVLVGSNCSYNYTKDSDLDIHLIADSSSLNCPEDLYPLLYSAYRSMFNKNYDINIKGIPAEIYVEMDNLGAAKSSGVYSINSGWIKEPVQQEIPDLDKDAFEEIFTEWEDKYFELLDSEYTSEDIKDFIEDIYDLRKLGIEQEGEFGLKNLVFKEFRNLGYLDNLKELRKEAKGKELSLEGLTEALSSSDVNVKAFAQRVGKDNTGKDLVDSEGNTVSGDKQFRGMYRKYFDEIKNSQKWNRLVKVAYKNNKSDPALAMVVKFPVIDGLLSVKLEPTSGTDKIPETLPLFAFKDFFDGYMIVDSNSHRLLQLVDKYWEEFKKFKSQKRKETKYQERATGLAKNVNQLSDEEKQEAIDWLHDHLERVEILYPTGQPTETSAEGQLTDEESGKIGNLLAEREDKFRKGFLNGGTASSGYLDKAKKIHYAGRSASENPEKHKDNYKIGWKLLCDFYFDEKVSNAPESVKQLIQWAKLQPEDTSDEINLDNKHIQVTWFLNALRDLVNGDWSKITG